MPPKPLATPLAELPAHLRSIHETRVRFCDTDLMGIVHHANYLAYFEAGRVDWLHKRGITYEMWVRQGIHLPVVETALRYKKAARFDDWLAVESICSAVTRVTVRFDYTIRRGEDELCTGHTLLACVGDDLLPKRIPNEIAHVFHAPESPREDWK
ncbi:MAG: acyl-CoA thioesterase [Polyangiaceae bacterium]